jgi:hypothetical protein
VSRRARPAGDEVAVDEAFVARLWRAQRFARDALRTTEGQPVEVVYPGRRRGERGPDFQEALLVFDELTLERGGVEVHLRASDWARHGHQRDPTYNATLLHVVLWDDAREPVRREDGKRVPTVALSSYLQAPLAELATELPPNPVEWPVAERGACGRDAAGVVARLEAAGLARFAEHQARFASDLEERSGADLLCAGLIEAIGYGANREPARSLAARLPYTMVRSARDDGAQAVQALLLGAAGLLPSQRGRPLEDEATALEAAWARLQAEAPTPLAAGEWRFFGVRPVAYPPRRLAGLGLLLAREPLEPVLADAARAVRSLAPRPAAKALAGALVVEAEAGYWREHWDFGRASARALPALLGPERAAEIVVNVLLPLLAAWGEALGDDQLPAAARACYVEHPPAGDNERLRHMRQQVLGGADRAATATACRQQGLLHVYTHTCGWRRCGECVVGPTATTGQ